MMHSGAPLTAAALFTETAAQQISPLKWQRLVLHCGGRGISGVCSRLISGPDAGGINKLRLDSLPATTTALPSSPAPHLPPLLLLTHSLSHSPLTLLINSTALRQTCRRNSSWLLTFSAQLLLIFLKKECK